MNKNELTEKALSNFLEIEHKYILPFLKDEFGYIDSVDFLYQSIDQCVDIYAYLVNGEYVIEFDLSHIDYSITKNEVITVDEYANTLKGKGKDKQKDRERLRILIDKTRSIT